MARYLPRPALLLYNVSAMKKRKGTDRIASSRQAIGRWEDERYALCREIPLKIKKTNEGFLVSDPVTLRYGVGATLEEAKDDYIAVLLEYYESLMSSEHNLAPHLKEHLRYLRTVIREKAAQPQT